MSSPNDWPEVSLGRLVRFGNGRDYKEVEDPDGSYPVIGSGGEFSRANDFLYEGESILFGRKGTIDRPRYINGRFWTVDTMYYTIPGARVVPRWLYYWATTIPFGMLATDTALPSMTSSALGALRIRLPQLADQKAIADFLDIETAQIDAMIEAQRDLVAALAERRSSVLEGALSAVWEYPHRRLQWLYRVSADCNRPDLEVLSVYRDFGVIPKSSRDDNFNKTPENVERYLLVRPDDLVTNRMKAWQGSLGVSKHLGIVSGDYEVARPTTPELLPEFAHFMLRSPRLIGEYRSRSTGIRPAQWRLYWDQMGQIVVPVPPPDVQAAQVHRVKESLSRIDLLVAAANESIVLMQERRSALISSAVTGRIDPRTGKESSPEKVLE